MIRTMATGFAAAALMLAPFALAQQVIGISAAVKNDVRIKKPSQPLPRPVQVKQRIALNDAVQTGAKSQLQVLLLDKSVFNIGANARLTIDRFVYDPNRGNRTFGATVTKGAFRFMSGKPDRGTGSQIRTPVASIGIRGTILEGVVGEGAALIASGETQTAGVRADPETATLVILRGPGSATQGNTIPGAITITAAGRAVNVERPMMAVFVPGPGRAPIGPFRISPRGLMQVQALLFPAVAQRLGISGPADNLGGDPGGVYYPPEQQRPDYPIPGGYRPGMYPGNPGGYPGRDNGPPGAGPGNYGAPGVPSFPGGSLPGGRDPRLQGRQPNSNAGQSPNGQQGGAAAGSPANAPADPAPSPNSPPNLKSAPPAKDPPAGQSPNSVVVQDNQSPRPSPSPTPTPSPNGKTPGKGPN